MTNKINSTMDSIAYFVSHSPLKSLSIVLILMCILLPGLKNLEQDFGYRIWFSEDDPNIKNFDRFERRFGNDDNAVILMHSSSGIFDIDSARTLIDITQKLWQIRDVIRVDSLANFNWTHAEDDDLIVEPIMPEDEPLTEDFLLERKKIALNHETLPGYLVSASGDTALIIATLKPALKTEVDYQALISDLRQLLSPYENTGDHQFGISGGAAINDAFRESTSTDLQKILPLLFVTVSVILLIIFKSFGGLVLPWITIIFSMLGTLGMAGHLGIKINNMTAFLPSILIGIGIADSIHILVTYFRFRRAGYNSKKATYQAMMKDIKPTLLTSLSTAIGFLSLIWSPIIPTVNLGLLAGFGSILAWIITIGLLGPLLSLMPLKVAGSVKGTQTLKPSNWVYSYSGWLQSNRYVVIVFFSIAALMASYLAIQNEVNSDTLEYFTDDVPLKQANNAIEKYVGWVSPVDFVIDSGANEGIKDPEFLNRANQWQQWVNDRSYVSKSTSIMDILKATHRALHAGDQAYYTLADDRQMIAQELLLYTMSLPPSLDLNNQITLDNRLIRVTVNWTLRTDNDALNAIKEIESKGEELGLNVYASGKYILWKSLGGYIIPTFFRSIMGALILVSILMCIFLGSIRIGLLSLIPNLLPIVFGASLIYISGTYADVGTSLVASVCLGIAVDDTIHILSSYHSHRINGENPISATALMISHTGTALIITTVILIAGFGTYALGSFVPNVSFGVLTASVLGLALFTDLTLLPAILFIFNLKSYQYTD